MVVHAGLAVGARFAEWRPMSSDGHEHADGVVLELQREPPEHAVPQPTTPEPPSPAENPEEAKPPELRAGIDGGTTTPTETWLGFATGSPMSGPVVESFEQAAFSKTDGGGSPPTESVAGEPPTLPAPAEAASDRVELAGEPERSETERAGDAVEDRPAVLPREGSPVPTSADSNAPRNEYVVDESVDFGVVPAGSLRPLGWFERLGLDRAARALREAIRRASAAAPAADAAESESPPNPPAVAPSASSARGDPGRAGERSDRETDASAKTEALVWSPGRPLAAKGVEFHPSAGEWSITTRRTTRPRDAVVTIEFNMRGEVVNADFVPGRGTGYKEVDGPLISSLYDWRISGKRLEELRRADPEQTVSFTIRIVFSR